MAQQPAKPESAAQPLASTKTPATKAKASVPPAAPIRKATPAPAASSGIQGIPAGAVKIDENTYRMQEKDGKVWLYRRNPFGVSKIEEKEASKMGRTLTPTETPATVSDLGDSYRFERAGPFGAKTWTKKKSELNDDERSIIEKNHQSPTQKAAN